MKKFLLACSILACITLAGCSAGYVATRPADVTYVRPVSPGSSYVWISGNWVWGGGNYHWQEGNWHEGKQGRTYKSGNWENDHNGYKWRKGRWE